MAIREAWWRPYETSRPDCHVYVNRWGDGARWGGATWRAAHMPTGTTAYIAFDRPVPDADALTQLFLSLDARVARATGGQPVTPVFTPRMDDIRS